MPKSISRKELISRLRAHGFIGPESGGKHMFMIKEQRKVHIPNPHKKEIAGPLVGEIIKQAGISYNEWNNY